MNRAFHMIAFGQLALGTLAWANINSVSSNHASEQGIGGLCRRFVWGFSRKVHPSGNVAFPDNEDALAFLASEIEKGEGSHLLPYADWRIDRFGEHDPFARYLIANANGETSEAAWLIEHHGKEWFSNWNRFFSLASVKLHLEGAWVRNIEVSEVSDWDAFSNDLKAFLKHYPLARQFEFTFPPHRGSGRQTYYRQATVSVSQLRQFFEGGSSQSLYEFLIDRAVERSWTRVTRV